MTPSPAAANRLTRSVLALAMLPLAIPLLARAQTFEPHRFALQSGDTVMVERGEFVVAERRAAEGGRSIPIRFLRLPSRAAEPGSPIVYLAGGPGGSGTGAAAGRRWTMFDRLRDVADLIIVDQGGTVWSNAIPPCDAGVSFPTDRPLTGALAAELHGEALAHCAAEWRAAGVDLLGYTTAESAADLDALRGVLGAERVSLLGISYGTHLALAALKQFRESIDRVVLASAEGLDHTVKLPARTDAYFDRLQAAIDEDPEARAAYPDVRGLISGVLERVAADPPRLTLRMRDGGSYERLLGPFDLRLTTGYMISDPDRTAPLLAAFRRAAEGDFGYFSLFLQRDVEVRGMPEAMDVASGITPGRLALVEAQSGTALLGDVMNFPMPHLAGALPGIDLGDEFRAPVVSDRPVLLLSTTLDGRTYPESHAEIARGLSRSGTLTVRYGGHNLFFAHPGIVDRIADFFGGAEPTDETLEAERPRFGGN